MPVISATECTIYSSISASAATVASSGLIPVVQERVNWICNNWFGTELSLQGTLTFNATARTITTTGGDAWASWGFAADDEIYVYRSHRNDGYYTISTIAGSALTLVSGSNVVDELSGRSILVSVVKWPADVKATAARMVAYDYDSRKARTPGLASKSLGPWSESYTDAVGIDGYPEDLIEPLYSHRIARLM